MKDAKESWLNKPITWKASIMASVIAIGSMAVSYGGYMLGTKLADKVYWKGKVKEDLQDLSEF